MIKKQPHGGHSDQGPSSKDWQPDETEPGGRKQAQKQAAKPEVQPGTAQAGKSWQSHRPDPDDKDDQLEAALEDSFPASDPPQSAQPGVTGWDAAEETVEKVGPKRPRR